jgi:hypothetical protein
MEKLVFLVIIAALVALLGRNRNIGYGWSFVLCLFLSPIIGVIIILFSKKVDSPAHNSTYKKLAVQWLNEALCFVSSSVLADSFRLRNRQLLVAAKRYCFLLSSPHSGFDQPDLAIANLAHLLLPSGQAHASAKSKELNFLTRKIIVLNKFFDYFLGNKNKSSKTLAFFTFASFNSYNP